MSPDILRRQLDGPLERRDRIPGSPSREKRTAQAAVIGRIFRPQSRQSGQVWNGSVGLTSGKLNVSQQCQGIGMIGRECQQSLTQGSSLFGAAMPAEIEGVSDGLHSSHAIRCLLRRNESVTPPDWLYVRMTNIRQIEFHA